MRDTENFRVGYVPAVATIEDRLEGRLGEPARVVVQHVSGWRIDYTEGARTADIFTPAGEPIDAPQVIEWEWDPPERGPSRADGPPPTPDQLAATLTEWVTDNHEGLDLPGLEA